jgi:hypothetical protein
VIQVLKNGTTLAQQVVNPVYIDIGIDPLTHIPQHYLGRAEITPGSTVLLTALTEEAVKHDPSTYTYTWEVNGKVIEGGAWKGNHQVQVPVPIGASTIKIKVSVSRPGIGKVGEETIEAPVRNTVTNFYRVSSLYGLLPQALENTYNLRDNAITIQAIPYFIGSEAMTGGTIEWKLDNRPMQPDTPFVITLKPNQAQGRSTVTFRQYNQSNFSQQAQQTLQVTY